MKVGIPKEVHTGERRVAGTPDTVRRLAKLGFESVVEAGAGAAASFPDAAYEEAGATVTEDTASVWADVDIVLKINPPEEHPGLGKHEADLLSEGGTLISFLWPAQNEALVQRLAARKATVFAMDQVPRISRAQKLDALSSMANISGYRAVVEAAGHFGSFFTGQFTAAGRVPPAKVLVIGAGVAGLAALGAARGLGAIVRAFDTRAAAKEQVESLGGEFLEVSFEESGDGGGGYAKVMSKEFIEAEMALFREQAKEIDIVITTALIPGRPAPKLWLADMVEMMKPGSVVVDLAASQGGNCDLTEPGEVVVKHGVTIVGHVDLTSRLATTASALYGTNLSHLLDDMGGGGGYHIDLDDEVVRGCIVLQDGELLWPAPKKASPPPPKKKAEPAPAKVAAAPAASTAVAEAPEPATGEAVVESKRPSNGVLIGAALLGLWVLLKVTVTGSVSVEMQQFLQHLTVFVLACFVGWQVIWNVTAALHTPLMSVTNAISGIIIVGGMLQSRGDILDASTLLGTAAILLATINIAGGFLVTQRMLRMFRR